MSENESIPVITEHVGEIPAAPAAPAPPPVEPPKAPELDSSREFAAITKAKRELLMKEKKLKEDWALVEKYQKLEAKKKEDPFGFMRDHEIDFDSLAQSALNQPESKGPETVEEKLARLEKRLADDDAKKTEAAKKDEESKQQAEIQRQVNEYSNKLTELISASPDDYEQISLENAQEEVLNYVIGYYNKTLADNGEGIVLDPKEAADKLEAYLVERNKPYAEKLFASKKLGLKRDQDQPTPAPARSMGATLSQQMTPASSAPAPRNETPEQRKARIVAEFNAANGKR